MGGGVIGKMDGFLQTLSKRYESRVTDGPRREGGTHGTVSYPCLCLPWIPPRLGPARDDVMSGMQELLLPGSRPSSQRKNDGRGRSVGRSDDNL